MRILVLGGTVFVGRAIVDDALRCGHDVTIFSRGRTGVDLFPAALDTVAPAGLYRFQPDPATA